MSRLSANTGIPPRTFELARYGVKERIAAGGMGVIHRAYDRLARRDVAYKRLVVPSEPLRARMTLMFQREYDTLARLTHPNIVECFDYGQDASGPYYAMELLTGADLSVLAPLPYPEACRILRDVASALALVHSRRLIHRDLSPANVRLTGDRRAKLIDFGALAPFGKPDELVGTAACMAPECLSNEALDQRSDLYALGAVAYWTLTGQMAVRARYPEELFEAWSEPILPPSVQVAGIPKELDALVLSLLAREPLARPSSAAYVIDRLTAIASLPAEADERRVAYSYLAHPPLTGREELRAAFVEAMAGAVEGKGRALFVEAAAGLGRSALLDDLALQAQIAGVTLLRARGDRSAGPFGLARKLTAFAYMLYLDLGSTDAARASFLSYSPGQKAQTAADVAERHAQVVAAVRSALFELGQRNPVVILVDDVHAADGESLSLLAALAQELGTHKLTMIVSALTTNDPDRLAPHLMLAASSRCYTLAPLSAEQTTELVRGVFGDVPHTHRFAQWLHSESGGNPATCIDLARLLLERGDVRYTLGTFTLPHTLDHELPTADLADAITARLGHLGPHAERVASALSLHEGALTPEQIAMALELAPEDALLALEELSGRDVVIATENGYSFAGSSLRETLKQRLDPARRRELHVRIAEALLRDADAIVDARFYAGTHLIQGGREADAAELVAELGPFGLTGESAARWGVLIEAVLAVFKQQKRSKEQFLALLVPLMHAGFHGELRAQRRHIDTALRYMSHVCGMTLAAHLRPFVGGKFALLFGLIYAGLRRAFTPKKKRLGDLPQMLAEFVGLVCAGTASAVSSDDTAAALRYNSWLEPLSALPPDSSGFLLREFCIATAEVGMGDLQGSAARYARLMPAMRKPIAGLDDKLRATLYRGCLNGRAQAEIQNEDGGALELAAELADGDPFFAPHAECARMGYYGYHGEQDRAELHRARAELFALRGGTSWSAETLICKRVAISAILAGDAIGLLQAQAAIERLVALAPNLQRFKLWCDAWLTALRGRPEQAVALYEQFVDREGSRLYYTWRFERVCYAKLLNLAGEHARAKAVCEQLLEEAGGELTDFMHLAVPQLALAEAGLGELERAATRLETQLERLETMNNALLLGDGQHARAQVALRARDRAAFDRYFDAMTQSFQATRNPSLIQQCDALLAKAVSAGLREGVAVRELGEDYGDGRTFIEELPENDTKRTSERPSGRPSGRPSARPSVRGASS